MCGLGSLVSEGHLLFPKARTPRTPRFIYATQDSDGWCVSEQTSEHDHMTQNIGHKAYSLHYILPPLSLVHSREGEPNILDKTSHNTLLWTPVIRVLSISFIAMCLCLLVFMFITWYFTFISSVLQSPLRLAFWRRNGQITISNQGKRHTIERQPNRYVNKT